MNGYQLTNFEYVWTSDVLLNRKIEIVCETKKLCLRYSFWDYIILCKPFSAQLIWRKWRFRLNGVSSFSLYYLSSLKDQYRPVWSWSWLEGSVQNTMWRWRISMHRRNSDYSKREHECKVRLTKEDILWGRLDSVEQRMEKEDGSLARHSAECNREISWKEVKIKTIKEN